MMNTLHRLAWVRAAKNRWLHLSQREQRLLVCGAVLLLALGLWQWGIAPAWHAVRTGPNQEAALVQQASQVLRAAQALENWRSQNARVVLSAQAVQERIHSERKRLGLDAQVLVRTNQQDNNGSGVLQLDVKEAPALAMLQYLNALERMAGVRLHEVALEAQPAGMLTGKVMVSIQP